MQVSSEVEVLVREDGFILWLDTENLNAYIWNIEEMFEFCMMQFGIDVVSIPGISTWVHLTLELEGVYFRLALGWHPSVHNRNIQGDKSAW